MKTHVAIEGGRHRGIRRECQRCQNAYMRNWRSSHQVSEEQRLKGTARSYANVYKRYGKLIPEPCEKCGSREVEMHHDDYSKPLEVRWLCRPHHLAYHQNKKRWVLADNIGEPHHFTFALPASINLAPLH